MTVAFLKIGDRVWHGDTHADALEVAVRDVGAPEVEAAHDEGRLVFGKDRGVGVRWYDDFESQTRGWFYITHRGDGSCE